MNLSEISSVAIYPPLGIARIGNSPEHFLASDIPGQSEVPPGGYKDSKGRIKKEVARFRIYAFDSNGSPLGELKGGDITINWRVEVANVKPAWYEFNNALDLGTKYAIPCIRRNAEVQGGYRDQLAIRPTGKQISGMNQKGTDCHFDDGKFYKTNVDLGHLETDAEGRLLFFAGDGGAASNNNQPITTFANNEGWHDDTCDGVIRASVKVAGLHLDAKPAMVAVTPPNFGPGLYGVVTMNDVVQNLFINKMGYANPSQDKVEFWRDIYPILERMTNTQWVNEGFFMLFGANSPSDFTDEKVIAVLDRPDPKNQIHRDRVFEWFRDPASEECQPAKVPPFYGDGFGDYSDIALDDLPVTFIQYERLKKWKAGDFVTGNRVTNSITFEDLSPAEQINALNQAPLEDCLGGPFHPGIELTWTMRVESMWEEPYRLKVLPESEQIQLDFGDLLTPEIAMSADGPLSVNGPGSLTRWMGVPWQTDEASCLSGYTVSNYLPLPSFWAARVPNQILSEEAYERMQAGNVNIAQRLKHFSYRQDWLRDIRADHLQRLTNMVEEWNELGIITKQEKKIPNDQNKYLPKVSWVEKGRHFEEGAVDNTFIQVKYAEDDPNIVQEDTEIEMNPLAMVSSLRHAKEKVLESKVHEPKSNRKRRTLGRDEM